MARKKPKQPANTLAGWAEIIAAQGRRDGVLPIPIEGARELVTIPPESVIWKPESNFKYRPEGAIVRLQPPADASDADVARVRAYFEAAGAARITVLPRPRADVVPQAAKEAPARAVGARQAVYDVIEESASKDKAKLRDFCEATMVAAGL